MEKLYVKIHNLETESNTVLPFIVKVSFKKQKFKTAKVSDKKYKFKEEFIIPLSSKENPTDCIHIELCTSLLLTVKVGEVFFSLNTIRYQNMVKKKIPMKDKSQKYLLRTTILVIRDQSDVLFFKMKQLFPQKKEHEIREVIEKEKDKKKVISVLKEDKKKTLNDHIEEVPQGIAPFSTNYTMNAQPDNQTISIPNSNELNNIGIQNNEYAAKDALPMTSINQNYSGNMNQPNMYNNQNMMNPINQTNPNVMNNNPMMQNEAMGIGTNYVPINSNFNGQQYLPNTMYQQNSMYQPNAVYQTNPIYQPNQAYQSSQTYTPSQIYQPIQAYNKNPALVAIGTNMYNAQLNPGADNIFFHTPQNKKKALLIGINYYGSNCELSGCVNDTLRMKNLLISQFGFKDSSLTMIRLIDNANDPNYRPTRNNILSACSWLTSSNQQGDVLFFLYSGHGSQQEDPHNIEEDGYNETILPCDHKQAGQITDDELHRYLIQPLHNGVKLVAVMDCCRAGTSLDLAYEYKWMKQKWKEIKNPFHVVCDVSQFSGCRDEEVAFELNNKKNAPGGSLVTALIYVLANAQGKLSYDVLLRQVNNCIQKYHSQTIAFMSSQKFDMSRVFDFENILMNKNQNLGLTINYYRQPNKKKRNPIFFL